MRSWLFFACVLSANAMSLRPEADDGILEEDGNEKDKQICKVENFVLHKNPSSMSADESGILKHIAEALNKDHIHRVMQDVSLLSRAGITCMDGRNDDSILSSPGGDLGEFVLALKVLEEISGKTLSQFDVDTLLVHILAHTPRDAFRACTDSEALTKLFKASGLGPVNNPALLKNPDSTLREILLKQLVVPDNVGDEHLRSLLVHPTLYQVRRELTAMAIKSFFRVMWNELGVPLSPESHEAIASQLDLTVFEGNHGEDAVVSIGRADCPNYVIVVPPAVEDHEIRLYYPAALHFTRAHLAGVILEQGAALNILIDTKHTVDTVSQRIMTLGDTLFETTVAQLAVSYGSKGSLSGFPEYIIETPSGCCPDQFRSVVTEEAVVYQDVLPRRQPPHLPMLCPAGTAAFSNHDESVSADKLRLDGFSIRQVAAHFQVLSGAPFDFVDAREWGVSSMDSRNAEEVLGVPGASVGQFALMLALLRLKSGDKVDATTALTNFVLSMKAPTFTYAIDVDTLYSVCGKLPVCPDRNVPIEEKLEVLNRIFSKPTAGVKEQLLNALSHSSGKNIGDPFLHFVMTDSGISSSGGSGPALGGVERLVVSALQKFLSKDASAEDLKTWLFTQSEWEAVRGMFGVEGKALRRSLRVRLAVQECIRDNPHVIELVRGEDRSSQSSQSVFDACRDILRRTAVVALDEDGDDAANQGDIEKKRQALKETIPDVIEAFFKLLWGDAPSLYQPYAAGISSKMDLVVIDGRANGHAFVEVKLSEECNPTLSPLLTPLRTSTMSSVWLHHPAAAKAYREGIASFFKNLNPRAAVYADELQGSATDLSAELMHRFVSQALYDQPSYDFVFTAGCCPTN